MQSSDARIEAVIFDLDDTLFPERQYVFSGYGAVARHLQEKLGTRKHFENWLIERYESGKTAGAFDALSAYFHLDLTPEQIGELVRVYRCHQPEIAPYEDVPFMLRRMRERFRLGLLSDGFQPAQRLKLAALGLEGLFDAVVFNEDIGRGAWKPSLTGFQHIRSQLGVPHETCAYVADNPAKDFLAPNLLQWLSVQFIRPQQVHFSKAPPDGGAAKVIVHDAAELRTVLER
jgi:putative hydrolase of the HAD superfamily